VGLRVGVPAAVLLAVAGSTLPGMKLQPPSSPVADQLQAAPAGLGLPDTDNQPRRHWPEDRLDAEERATQAAASGSPAPINISLATAEADAALGSRGGAGAVGAMEIPVSVLAAYHRAEQNIMQSDPSCHLPWWVLAGIGRIESGHASGGRVDESGTTRGTILGPRLDGSLAGTAVIADSDGGALDGDAAYDRAVGPMQFLPGTWRSWGRDGNGDGVVNPHNVYDAATAAGVYLCAGVATSLSAPIWRERSSATTTRPRTSRRS